MTWAEMTRNRNGFNSHDIYTKSDCWKIVWYIAASWIPALSKTYRKLSSFPVASWNPGKKTNVISSGSHIVRLESLTNKNNAPQLKLKKWLGHNSWSDIHSYFYLEEVLCDKYV